MTMNINEIKNNLLDITKTFLDDSVDFSRYGEERSVLHTILSESIQAITFVTLIEDEFEIEFDDDEIDMDFFLSFDRIAELVQRHLEDKPNLS